MAYSRFPIELTGTMSGMYDQAKVAAAWVKYLEFFALPLTLEIEELSIDEAPAKIAGTSSFQLKTFATADPDDPVVRDAICHTAEFMSCSLHPCNMHSHLNVNGRLTFIASVSGGYLD